MQAKHLISAVVFTVVTLPAVALAGKTTICHIPPGNPDNAHAISVSDSAVSKHVSEHGDTVMSAGASCGTATAAIVPNNTISAAVEVCSASGTAPGRRIDVSGLGGVQTSTINCGG